MHFLELLVCKFFFFFFCLAAGRKDIKAEFRVMASSLSKEMKMMEAQLKRWQDTAHETLSLCEKAQSLRILLSRKVCF